MLRTKDRTGTFWNFRDARKKQPGPWAHGLIKTMTWTVRNATPGKRDERAGKQGACLCSFTEPSPLALSKMSPLDHRKRKAGSVSKDDETDTSSYRLTKQLKEPAPPTHEIRGPSLLDLPAGVVANIGKYLRIAESAGDDDYDGPGDLMALSIVFGSAVAAVIRYEYLHNNLAFLSFIYGDVSDFADTIDAYEVDYSDFTRLLSNTRASLEQWMEANDWWKEACRDFAFFRNGCEKRVTSVYPPIYKIIQLEEIINGDEEERDFQRSIKRGMAHNYGSYYDDDDDDGLLGDDYTILSINGTDIKDMKQVEVEAMLSKDGDKRLCVMHGYFDLIFLNPAFIIDLGILDVLQFQVEELKLDLTCQEYLGIFLQRPADFHESMPLVVHSLLQPDKDIFLYLISVENFEANPVMKRAPLLRRTLLHMLPDIVNHDTFIRNLDLDKVELILQKDEVDVDSLDLDGRSPLERLCEYCTDNYDYTSLAYNVAQLYLTFGANVSRTLLSLLDKYVERFDRIDGKTSSRPEHVPPSKLHKLLRQSPS